MGAIASQITSLAIIYSTVYSGADQRKRESSASLAFLLGIHRGPVNSPHKWQVTRKMFSLDDVIMMPVCSLTESWFSCMRELNHQGWQPGVRMMPIYYPQGWRTGSYHFHNIICPHSLQSWCYDNFRLSMNYASLYNHLFEDEIWQSPIHYRPLLCLRLFHKISDNISHHHFGQKLWQTGTWNIQIEYQRESNYK